MQCDEPSCIDRAKAGDPEAFRCLFDLHKEQLLAYWYHLGCNDADAEDLSQGVFLRGFLGLKRLRSNSLRSYLFKIAHNLFVDFVRKQHPAEPDPRLQDGSARPASTPSEPTEIEVQLHEVEACLDRIFTPRERSVFLGAYREGRTLRELAGEFGLPITTINNWISRRDLIKRLQADLTRSAGGGLKEDKS